VVAVTRDYLTKHRLDLSCHFLVPFVRLFNLAPKIMTRQLRQFGEFAQEHSSPLAFVIPCLLTHNSDLRPLSDASEGRIIEDWAGTPRTVQSEPFQALRQTFDSFGVHLIPIPSRSDCMIRE
jgi:hypothetical protein